MFEKSPDRIEVSSLYEETFLDKFNFVSFDIFDTLLVRDTVTHFRLWRRRGNLFALERALGEIVSRLQARARGRYEVKSAEIYRWMRTKWRFEDEIDLEDSHLLINSEIENLISRFLKSGKQVVLISDTHFSSQVLERWLSSRGLPKLQIFTSQEFLKPKSRGLFDHVKSNLSVDSDSWLHVGDNSVSDVIAPQRLGITAVHYPKLRDQLVASGLLSDKALTEFLKAGADGETAITKLGLGFVHQTYPLNRVLQSLQAKIGSVIAMPISRSIAQQVAMHGKFSSLSEYWFVSRDGWLPYLSFQSQFPNLPSRYFKTSRQMLTSPRYEGYVAEFLADAKQVFIYDLGWRGTTLQKLGKLFPKTKFTGVFVGLLNSVTSESIQLFKGSRLEFLDIWRARDLLEVIFSDPTNGYSSLDENNIPLEAKSKSSLGEVLRVDIAIAAQSSIDNLAPILTPEETGIVLRIFSAFPSHEVKQLFSEVTHDIDQNEHSYLIHSNWQILFSAQPIMWPQAAGLLNPKYGKIEISLFRFACLLKELVQRTRSLIGRKIQRP